MLNGLDILVNSFGIFGLGCYIQYYRVYKKAFVSMVVGPSVTRGSKGLILNRCTVSLIYRS